MSKKTSTQKRTPGSLHPACSTAPSWDDFVARIAKCAPILKPIKDDPQWLNLYGIYEIGYSAAVESVLGQLTEMSNDQAHLQPLEAAVEREGDNDNS